ncbi:hypothetical protein ES332_D06G165000v1, partial [Gossypium tomentosum]
PFVVLPVAATPPRTTAGSPRYCVQRLRMWHVRRRRCAYEARASGATCEGTSAAALVGADARASHPIVIGSGLG